MLLATMKSFFADRLARGGAVLAPMAGFTDAPFRKLCREHGSAWAVTEMVSAKALILGNRRGIEIGEPYPGEPDLVIQLFAADPDLAGEAAAVLAERYRPAALDLNMGCPVKKIVNRGCGVELMGDPARAAKIVAAMVASVDVPVSVKMRLGIDRFVAREVAQAVVDAGASAVAVHGRTGAQKYRGEADWQRIFEVADAVSVPVLGSGDVGDIASYRRYRTAGLGVMVARASLGRPWLFAELLGGRAPGLLERGRLAYRHAHLNGDWYGEAHGMRSLRGQLGRYFAGTPLQAELRPHLVRVSTLDELRGLLRSSLGSEVSHPVEPLPRAA
jgi:nifR3 family TIM-barrel protein